MNSSLRPGSVAQWTNLRGYQSALSSSLFPTEVKAGTSSDAFEAHTAVRRLGRMSLVSAQANTPLQIQTLRPRSHAESCYVLHFQLAGDCAYTHLDGCTQCSADTLILTNSRENLRMEQLTSGEALVVRIPNSIARYHLNRIDDLCWIASSAEGGTAGLLRNFMLSAWDCCEDLSVRDQEILQHSLITLLETVFDGRHHSWTDGEVDNARLLDRLKREIAARLHDSDLNADNLAQSVGASRSKLYRVTGGAGTTVQKLIIDMRLDWIAEALISDSFANMTITELAFEAGFSDVAHFSRRFKSRFGCSPSDYRAAGRQGRARCS